MGSLLAGLTTLVVTVLAALLAAPYVIDWNQYKYVFEEQAAKMMGRPARIDGSIELTILPIPEIRVTGLRIADEAGSFRTPFVESEGFVAVLALPALLSGTVEAREMQLDQPVIRFQLDASGRGNWTTLAGGGASGVPASDLILHNVVIKNGTVEYRGAPDASATRIEQISGSFSADSLYGPFRFNGVGAIGRDKRELKFSAGRVQNGATRLKASMTSGSGASLYQLDGDLKNLGSAMQYTGPVLARLELGARAAGTGAEPSDKSSASARPKAIELKAASTITLQDAKLQDIALTVTENDRPQSFTGSAYAAWGENPRLDMSVQTTYLDIDQMAGTPGGKANPLDAVAILPQIFEGWAFDPREGKIKAAIQQANLGGDIIENVTFAASHNREYWQVETFDAKLPGEAALSIKGVLRPGDKIGFTGDFNLSGKNLSRLLHWTAPGLGVVDTGDAQRFSLKGGLTFAEQRLTFRKAAGELGDSTFSGDLAYDASEASKLMLTLQSDRLDLRAIYGGSNPFAAEAAVEPGAQPAPKSTAGKTSLFDAFRTVFAAKQSQFNLHIAQLTMPDLEARDVRTVFGYENGTLDIREFNLATTDGLSIKADGTLTAMTATPSGSVNVGVNASSAASVATLAKIVGLEGVSSAARRRMDALAPLRLNGRVSGNRDDRTLTLTLAGNAAGSEVTLSSRLSGEIKALREARMDFGGTIANADGRRLITQVAADAPLLAEPARPGAGVLTISAQGSLKAGLDSRFELHTPEADGRFEGQLAPLADPWSLKGALWLRATQASTALAMLRLSPGGTPIAGDLDLRATLTKSAQKLQIDDVALQLAGQRIAGSARIDLGGQRPVVDIEARAGLITVPKLAAYLVDWDRKDISPAGIGNLLASSANPWPNQSFAFGNFNAVEGHLRLKAQSIALMDGITLANGQFDVSLKDSTLNVESLKGQLYSGFLTASGTLLAADGRAVLNGNLKLDKADLAKLTTANDGKPLAKGTGELRLAFTGEGLSPRGLLTVLSGKGRVRINKGTLYGLSPAVLGQAGDAYLLEEIPQQSRLVTRISRDLRAPQGQMPFRGFIAPVVLKDGVLEIRRSGFKSPDALATTNLLVDLQAMRLDSEWNVAWRGKTKTGVAIAPVRLVFAGPISSFTALQPQLHTEGLERALSAVRMDREMEKLEKLGRPPAAQSQPLTPPAARDTLTTPTPAPAQPANTINAPSAAVPAAPNNGIPTQQTAAPPQPQPQPQPQSNGQWSAGIVEMPGQTGSGPTASPPAAPGKPAASFEDEIRRVLREPQQKAPLAEQPKPRPAPSSAEPKNDLSYQTQSYSQADAVDVDGPAQQDAPAPEQHPTLAAPLPERRSTALKKPAPAPTPLQQLLGIFQ